MSTDCRWFLCRYCHEPIERFGGVWFEWQAGAACRSSDSPDRQHRPPVRHAAEVAA